jgi:hypothetical protein
MVHKKPTRSHRSSKRSRANRRHIKVDPLVRGERLTRKQWSDNAIRRANDEG